MGYAAEYLTRGAFAAIPMGFFIAHVYAHIIPFLGCWKVDELDAQMRVFDAQRRVFGAQARVFDAQVRVFDAQARVSDAQVRVFDAQRRVSDAQARVFRARLRAPPRGKSAATAINGDNKALGVF